jgi:hypothetical protein
VRQLVFLGTPHHGAPLERAGNFVDGLLGSNMYSAPFAALAQLRSAGITDLRHGALLDGDAPPAGRFQPGADRRMPVPLPPHVACYAVAATTERMRGPLAGRMIDHLVGDGLVPLPSALGRHADAARTLAFAEDHQHVFFGLNHLQLLHHPAVTQRLLAWLAAS